MNDILIQLRDFLKTLTISDKMIEIILTDAEMEPGKILSQGMSKFEKWDTVVRHAHQQEKIGGVITEVITLLGFEEGNTNRTTLEKLHQHYLEATAIAKGQKAGPDNGLDRLLPSRAPIILAIEEEGQPIEEDLLLKTERHMTITLSQAQVAELEQLSAVADREEAEISDIMQQGMDAWQVLENAQPKLRMLLEGAQQSTYPQPIAWTGYTGLLIRIHRAVLMACSDFREEVSSLISVHSGSHYFTPLYRSDTQKSMQKRQRQDKHSSIRFKAIAFPENCSEEELLPAIAPAVANDVLYVAAPDIDLPVRTIAEMVGSQYNSATRLVIGVGRATPDPGLIEGALNTVPCLSMAGPGLEGKELIRQIQGALRERFSSQSAPTVLSDLREKYIIKAFQTRDTALFKDAIGWTTWSWIGRPLFADQFGAVIPAAYPHLMDLRSIASKDWYFDRSKDIPDQYKAENLIKSQEDPEDKFHLYLSGAGGTGKSCFLRYVYEIIEINHPQVLPVWYRVDAPSSEWENVEKRIKEEVAAALEKRHGAAAANLLPGRELQLGNFLNKLLDNFRQAGARIGEVVVFIDQLERTFESGDNPEFHRLENISRKFINLLHEVGVGKGIRIFIASRKQYLPDFLSSFHKAQENGLHFNVLQKISDEYERIGFVERILTWCKKKDLVPESMRFEEAAAKELANAVNGHPLNMMLALIQIFSQGRSGKITKEDVENMKPWEELFYLDKQLAAKDDIDWYFLLAMAHARTEIVRFEEVWWRLRLVSPALTRSVNHLGPKGLLERLWLQGHLGRTIYARPLDGDPARFLEFFHANLRDHLIRDVMNYGGGELRIKGRKGGTPPAWRALDRLAAVARDWEQSQQLLLREDVRVLMEKKEVFVEPLKKKDGGEEKEAFYLLYLRDTRQIRDKLFEATKECIVYSAVVYEDLGKWAFKRLYPNVADQVACCKKWIQRCDAESRIRLLQYLLELNDAGAGQLLADIVFDQKNLLQEEAWLQIANILSEPLFAARYRSAFMVSLLEYMVKNQIPFPAGNWQTRRFGAFCTAACNADKNELLALFNDMAERTASLQRAELHKLINPLIQKSEHLDSWLEEAVNQGVNLSLQSREIHGLIPPRIELVTGSKVTEHLRAELVLQWQNDITAQIGLPLPAIGRSAGEDADHEIELRLDGRRVAIGDFFPGLHQTLRRHWSLKGIDPPPESQPSLNEALQEAVVWLPATRLSELNWDQPSWSFEQAVFDWLLILIRQHVNDIFGFQELIKFVNEISDSEDARLNVSELLQSFRGNYLVLQQILINLVREKVPVSKRKVELMVELQQLVRQTNNAGSSFLTQKLREHVGPDLCKAFTGHSNQLPVMLLDEKLEERLIESLVIKDNSRLELSLSQDQHLKLAAAIRRKFEEIIRTEDIVPVLICEENLRLSLFKMLRQFDNRLYVLSFTELTPEVMLTLKGIIADTSIQQLNS